MQRPVRLRRPMRSMRLQRFLRPQNHYWGPKIYPGSYSDLWNKKFFGRIMKNHGEFWHFFLSEAVEARICHFFKNWFLKLKFHNLRMSEPTSNKFWIGSFYLTESIWKIHFNVRHPVETLNLTLNYLTTFSFNSKTFLKLPYNFSYSVDHLKSPYLTSCK